MSNKPLHIFIASPHERSTDVGAAGSDFCLAKALEERGHEVDLFFYDDAFTSKKIRGYWKQLFFPWVLAKAFLKKNAQNPYDILDCGTGSAWVADLMLSTLRKRKKLLISSRIRFMDPQYVELESKLTNSQLRRKFQLYHSRYFLSEFFRDCRVADLIVVLSHINAMYLSEKIRVQKEKIRIIPNGIGNHFFKNNQDKTDIVNNLFNIMYLGRWQWVKGVHIIPKIMEQLFKEDERYRLTCAGVLASEKEVLQNFPERYRHRVTIVSRFENATLPALMKHHGILIAPSYMETYSRAVLEGMACGLIVVTTPVGGAPELIHPGKNGFLVSIGDVQGFIKAIQNIIFQSDHMRNVSERAIETIKDFTWANCAKGCEEAYFEKLSCKN